MNGLSDGGTKMQEKLTCSRLQLVVTGTEPEHELLDSWARTFSATSTKDRMLALLKGNKKYYPEKILHFMPIMCSTPMAPCKTIYLSMKTECCDT